MSTGQQETPSADVRDRQFSYFSRSVSGASRQPLSPTINSEIDTLSPDVADRVFPIRSTFDVDHSQQIQLPGPRTESLAGSLRAGQDIAEDRDDNSRGAYESASSVRAASQVSGIGGPSGHLDESLITSRFSYQKTQDGYMVVTGIAGSEKLQRCEDEPIQCPGAVQSFGCLVVLKMDPLEESVLSVRIASENCEKILSYSPQALFNLPSFARILSDEQTENLLDHIDFLKDDDADILKSGPEVFSLIVTGADALQIKLWCAIHLGVHDSSLVICEFELEDDSVNPIAAQDEITPAPADTLNSDPTEEELNESTISMSRPLRVLRHARRRKGEAAAMEVFSIMSQIHEQLSSAQSLESFLKVLVGVIKELTGFHRVMVYQFDESWNGRVVTELVDYRATKDLYKGLNFPASDIPQQAREMYKINKVRLLYDRDQESARLVCRSHEDLEVPLDMTHAYLRAMSPIHVKYLENMAVRASMSISIVAFGELWGLISCHAYGQRGMRVSFPIRKLCRLIGETASRNIERLSYASRLQARKLINTVPTEANPSGYIVASSDDLLKLFNADFGLLSIKDETKVLGKMDDTQEALVLLEYFRMRKFSHVTMSQNLAQTFPDLKYAPGFKNVAGALLVPLSSAGKDFIVFFRKGHLRQVHWAGNPYEKTTREGTDAFLEPRKSFKIWSETVVGKSREWTEEEIETAAVLCLVYGKFIEVWREKEAALQNSQLTRILLANASHEVRTPLNAIINYLEIALESPLDHDIRDSLSKSHSASKSLIYVINDLLDLTRTEEGHDLVKEELFDLPATIREATDVFKADATRKGISFEVVEYPGVPRFVAGDQSKIRQAVANIAANAVSHTSEGGVQVEVWLAAAVDNKCEIEIAVQDTGSGMSSKKLDTLFRELEQVQTDQNQDPATSDSQAVVTSQNQNSTIGLGLAVVARIIRNMNGQLRLKSEEGKGSRFTIQMSFQLPEPSSSVANVNRSAQRNKDGKSVSMPSHDDDQDITLVKKVAGKPAMPPFPRRESMESITTNTSIKSNRSVSSQKSQADRLIDAIQGSPHWLSPASDTNKSQTPWPGSIGNLNDKARTKTDGVDNLEGNISAIKPVKLPDDGIVPGLQEEAQLSSHDKTIRKLSVQSSASRASSNSASPARRRRQQESPSPGAEVFSVLVAEDDPINSKIIKKRLEKMGHAVHLTFNGEQCATKYKDNASTFDVVLMDIQMPIMDGFLSTQRIRSHEVECPQPPRKLQPNERIPIIAVSASLLEEKRQVYINQGFDAWILKPIDFKRLDILMKGITSRHIRSETLYEQGQWERGGWFHEMSFDEEAAAT